MSIPDQLTKTPTPTNPNKEISREETPKVARLLEMFGALLFFAFIGWLVTAYTHPSQEVSLSAIEGNTLVSPEMKQQMIDEMSKKVTTLSDPAEKQKTFDAMQKKAL